MRRQQDVFMQQVIQAANICCEHGIFHRDVKPEKLLENPDTMEVKLIDFGCGALVNYSAFKDFSGINLLLDHRNSSYI